MNKHLKLEMQRAIARMENRSPADDLIRSYGDFLRVRDYLCSYPFSPAVFDSLLELANSTWKSEKRISRLSLLQKIRQYAWKDEPDRRRNHTAKNRQTLATLPPASRRKLFELFRKLYEESCYISVKQLEVARKTANSLLINIPLTRREEAWFCENAFQSDMILNRCLRYPKKSKVISQWARDNFTNDRLRSRRPELLSWILDQEPRFVIDLQTLLDDFDHLNQLDRQAIRNYKDEIRAGQLMERELGEYLGRKRAYTDFEGLYHDEGVDLSRPELPLSRRPYHVPNQWAEDYRTSFPDFDLLKQEFDANLLKHRDTTMIWAIGYSRLDLDVQAALLKGYYSAETCYSIYKVCKRTGNSSLLRWMLEQP